jgi:hypothetical protein
MACDYYVLRNRKIRLSHLYRMQDSSYIFWKGVNWRAIPAWISGWMPTIGGLVVSVRGDVNPPRALLQLYYMAFLIGKYTRAAVVLSTDKHDRLLYQWSDILPSKFSLPSRKYGPDGRGGSVRHLYAGGSSENRSNVA